MTATDERLREICRILEDDVLNAINFAASEFTHYAGNDAREKREEKAVTEAITILRGLIK